MIAYHYILYANIFHVTCLFFICRAIVKHPDQWTIIEMRIEKSIHNHASFR